LIIWGKMLPFKMPSPISCAILSFPFMSFLFFSFHFISLHSISLHCISFLEYSSFFIHHSSFIIHFKKFMPKSTINFIRIQKVVFISFLTSTMSEKHSRWWKMNEWMRLT
jgi:hypothetical protein